MAEIKHVGRLKKNNRKVVVAYRVIPGENPPANALVIDTATLKIGRAHVRTPVTA